MAYILKESEEALQIKGLPELNRALDAIGAPVEAIKNANKESGALVAKEARLIAPSRTGALRRTIRVADIKTSVRIRAGMARVPYANPIHWGWFKRGIKPNPFFSRVLGWNREEILATCKKQMDKLIKSTTPRKP